MNKRFSLSVVIGVLILVISVISVKSVYLTAKPTVDTAAVHINEGQATLKGMIHNTGGRDVTCYGFRWGTSSSLDKTENLSGSINTNQTFSTTITGLKEGVTYYYRAFAINSKGTVYGDIKSFTVPVKYNAPPVVSITSPGDSMTITPGEVVKIAASATDDKKVESMELHINNIAKKKTDSGALTYIWDTSGMDAGKYVIKATAGDGVKTDEKTINITIKDDLKKVAQAEVTPAANKVPSRTKTVATPSRGVNYNYRSNYPRLSQYNGSFGQFYYRDGEARPPKIHLSSPKDAKNFRNHADNVEASFLLDFLAQAKKLDRDFDVMIEAKNKDLALFNLMDELKQIPHIRFIDEGSIEV